jgi:hypothetical protein
MAVSGDPLAVLERVPPPAPSGVSQKARLSAADFGIPKEDHDLFSRLLEDPKITDLYPEIAYLRYLRVKLQESFEARRFERVHALGEAIMRVFKDRMEGSGMGEEARGTAYSWVKDTLGIALAAHFPILDLDAQQANALRGICADIGKIISEWKKVTDGITVNLNSNEDEIYLRILREVIIPAVPREYHRAILGQAEKVAMAYRRPVLEGEVLDLG